MCLRYTEGCTLPTHFQGREGADGNEWLVVEKRKNLVPGVDWFEETASGAQRDLVPPSVGVCYDPAALTEVHMLAALHHARDNCHADGKGVEWLRAELEEVSAAFRAHEEQGGVLRKLHAAVEKTNAQKCRKHILAAIFEPPVHFDSRTKVSCVRVWEFV